MNSNMITDKIGNIIDFNPNESLPAGSYAKKIAMEKLTVGQRKINGYEFGVFSSGAKFKNGDTLLAKITPCLENGKTAQVDILEDDEVAFGSTEFIVLRETDKIDKDYLFYLARSPHFRQLAISCMEGTSGRKRVSESSLQLREITIHKNKEQQQRIAKVLSDIDKKIEVNNKIIKELESMAKELYDYWFVQFDFPDKDGKPYRTSGGKMIYNPTIKREIPLGWEVDRLDIVTDCLFGFPFDTSHFNEQGNGVPVVRIRDIIENSISCFSDEEIDEKYLLLDNDIVIGMDGNFHINLWTNGGAYLNQRCSRVRSINAEVPSLIIINQIAPYIKHRELTVSRTTVGHLSNDDIRKIPLIMPKLKNDITSRFDNYSRKIIECKKQNRELATLRDWLLPMLMNGQVTVSADSNNDSRVIPVDAHIIGGHIVKELYGSAGWGRTKLQKALHLVEYHCQLNLNSQAVRQTAGPFDSQMMNTLDTKFKQFGHVVIRYSKDIKGRKRYDYIPTAKISEIEYAFDNYSDHKKIEINNLLSKLKKMDLQRAEVISTLYAVWNNRIIKNQEITDDLLLDDFYAWSPHKSDFNKELVLKALMYMRKEDIVPKGWGRYIDKV